MSKRYATVLLGLLGVLFIEHLTTALPGRALTANPIPPTTSATTPDGSSTQKPIEVIDMGSVASNRPVQQKAIKFTLPVGMSSFKITANDPITHFGLSSTGGYLTAIAPNREVTVLAFPQTSQEGTFSQIIFVHAGNQRLKTIRLKVTILPPAPIQNQPTIGG